MTQEHNKATLRVGHGFDVHPFSPQADRSLVLGGLTLAGPGLAGDTDADVICHAITEAILIPAGLATSVAKSLKADSFASSVDRLSGVANSVGSGGWTICNVDVTIICETPAIAPHIENMQAVLTAAVGAQVTIKAKHAEGLGDIGRGLGIACHAVALLIRSPSN